MSTSPDISLHNYFRSSSSYRVRIALNLKGLPYTYLPVHLNRSGGEQLKSPFLELNPQALVPVFEDGQVQISQSLAMLEYLEERFPEAPLLPGSLGDRAYVRQLSLAIACEIHPLNNLRVLKFLTGPMGLSEAAKGQWIHHWISLGLSAVEAEVQRSGRSGAFCLGDTPTLADCCLVPQLFNAERFDIDLTPYPTLRRIDANCRAMRQFQDAHPAEQPDAE